ISAITGTYGSFTPMGGGSYLVGDGVVVSGGALAGGQIKDLKLDFSTFLSNPGLVGVSNINGGSTILLAGPQAMFGFDGPLLLAASPGGVTFSGAAHLVSADAALDMSAFANGAVFTMTFDPTQFMIQAGPNGGTVTPIIGLVQTRPAIEWSFTPEVGGGG